MTNLKDEVKYIKFHPGYTPPTIKKMTLWDATWELDKQGYSCTKVFDHKEDRGTREMQFTKPNCKTTVTVTAYYDM